MTSIPEKSIFELRHMEGGTDNAGFVDEQKQSHPLPKDDFTKWKVVKSIFYRKKQADLDSVYSKLLSWLKCIMDDDIDGTCAGKNPIPDVIPDVIYCIMSTEDKVKRPKPMKKFLYKLVESALLTGALIITDGLDHGITKMICDILKDEEDRQKQFCLKKDVFLVGIVPETLATGYREEGDRVKKTKDSEPEKTRLNFCHDFFVLLASDGNDDDSKKEAFEIALTFLRHLKASNISNGSLSVPKDGNHERESRKWKCKGCDEFIFGPAFCCHCEVCCNYYLCYDCNEKKRWPKDHSCDIDEFNTWKMVSARECHDLGEKLQEEVKKGAWRCTVCGDNIWDKVYLCKDEMCKDDILCGYCKDWQKYSEGHNKQKELGIALPKVIRRPLSVTWVLLQGGKLELAASKKALKAGIRVITTYGDGGIAAGMVAAIKSQQEQMSEKQIRGMVRSSVDMKDHDKFVEDLVEISELLYPHRNNKAPPENEKGILKDTADNLKKQTGHQYIITRKPTGKNKNVKIITCGIDGSQEDGDLMKIISGAIYKAADDSPQAQLQLLAAENGIPRARKLLRDLTNRQNISYEDIMMSALVLGRVPFFELLLENGMPLQAFLTLDNLHKLYESTFNDNEVLNDSDSCYTDVINTAYRIDEDMFDSGLFSGDVLQRESRDCIDLLKKIFAEDKGSCKITCCTKTHAKDDCVLDNVQKYIAECTEFVFQPNYSDKGYKITERDLFFWALLCGRTELAKVIWSVASDHVALALLGAKVLRCLKKESQINYENELSEILSTRERDISKLACNTIKLCYERHPTKAQKLLDLPVALLDKKMKMNCLELAWTFNMKYFLSETCSQAILSTKWKEHGIKSWFAPRAQYVCSILSTVCLLVLFTIFVLTDLHPYGNAKSPTVLEIIVTTWVSLLILNELYLAVLHTCRHEWKRVMVAWSNIFIKVVSMVLFLISLFCRYLLTTHWFGFARVMYSLTLGSFYLNLLPLVFASEHLGPKLIMIVVMVKQLITFIVILGVFVLAYGTAYEAILHPNDPHNFLYTSYYKLHGDLLTEEMEIAGPHSIAITCILNIMTGIYVLIGNVLLLNLLIAVFTMYIEKIQNKSNVVWSYYRYGLIKEYADKFLPMRGFPFYPMLWLVSKCTKGEKDLPSGSSKEFELRRFEHTAVRPYREKMRTNLKAIEGEYWNKWDRQLHEKKTQDKDIHGIHR
ncbi:transient receptor potential cation channel subfamily M member 3-like [Glandiceps talaboti]